MARQARPRMIREFLGDTIAALCVFAIPYAIGLIVWAFH